MPNNNRFSQCSINLMRGVMDVKGSCFVGVLSAQRCGFESWMPPHPPRLLPALFLFSESVCEAMYAKIACMCDTCFPFKTNTHEICPLLPE
jgi:hypothetical protein